MLMLVDRLTGLFVLYEIRELLTRRHGGTNDWLYSVLT
jgi:hypothetical protein